ncbi:aminotransferase class III-fold pyridoxal phosphate-dependent enzyme [Ramlibacter sp. WS9]|uniref:aminotransferase class III-fold pyridoxal phosphate-dependent enzyme n=1 Tax=Ramlibacter sp. WS9 TaxID=1882741 RepID=UPI0011425D23|nr:aminotransferase class III-fold pyridoxal phosphate-dependent enzyme [Ramlibacter sp. WS9]ROZ78106.1 aminotransferase class III-fold pyridoxal phosphate-dependent enzyme [Ramlibacter sp. WS9]HSV36695.1 aminotransferase class III-fold pyridoxal phosphate-dependent enzyme [Ramlibacter sp.]
MKTGIDQLKQDNAQYLFHPMAHPQAMQKTKPDIIARGEGCWIWDIDGHKMIDGVAGLWSSNLGHSNKRVRDAIVAQLDELPFYNTFRGTTHPRAIELSARVVKMMQPDGVGAVMFGNSGSDAVEGALKIARQYWKVLGQPERTKFISLKQGYHGVHFGGMSVNGLANIRRAYEPLMPGCFHVDSPWLYRNAYTQDPEELGRICAGLLEREIQFQGADTVAAFIAEPVQGSAGVIVPPPNFWPLVREVCERHKVLLIADEVVTGFGRSGAMFGTRLWGTTADIWCLAKGISSGYVPLGATALSKKVADAFLADTAGLGTVAHGYTYSGHPVAAAAALATLDELEEKDVVGNVARVGAHFQERMAQFERKFSFVGNVRGVGLMTGIEMVTDKAKRTPQPRSSDIPARVAREAYQRGAMVRISGPNMILSPPLVITREEVDHLVDILEASYAAVDKAL